MKKVLLVFTILITVSCKGQDDRILLKRPAGKTNILVMVTYDDEPTKEELISLDNEMYKEVQYDIDSIEVEAGSGKTLLIYYCNEKFIYNNESNNNRECVPTFESTRMFNHNSELINEPYNNFKDVDYSKRPDEAFNFIKEWWELNFKSISKTYTKEMKHEDLSKLLVKYNFLNVNDAKQKISIWLSE